MYQLVWRLLLGMWSVWCVSGVAKESVGNAVPCRDIHANNEGVFQIEPTFMSSCSAVWIEIPDPAPKYDVAITAGHCAGIQGESRPKIEGTNITALANFVSKDTEDLWRSKNPLKKWRDDISSKTDLGVLLFPLGTAAKLGVRHKPKLAPFATKLEKGDTITFAGFEGKPDRSCGRAKIFSVSDPLIFLEAGPEKRESYSNPGDSGGGVFNAEGQLIAIFSAGERAAQSIDKKNHSVFVRTTSPFAYGMWSAVMRSADWVPKLASIEPKIEKSESAQTEQVVAVEGATIPEDGVETIPSPLQYRLITQNSEPTPLIISYFDVTSEKDFKADDKKLDSYLQTLQARINQSAESDRPLVFKVLVTPAMKTKLSPLPKEYPAVGVFAAGKKVAEFIKVSQGDGKELEALLEKGGYAVPGLVVAKAKEVKSDPATPDPAVVAATKATLRNAFPAFAHRSALAVPMDLIKASTRIEFDASGENSKATGEAVLEFRIGQSGMPVFDIDCPILGGSINGKAVEKFDEVVPPAGKATVWIVPETLPPFEIHRLQIKYRLKKGIKVKSGEVVAKFGMSDLADLDGQAKKTYWQPYGPTSFEYDSYDHRLAISVVGANTRHRVFTNGRFIGDSDGYSWSIQYPAYFNNSSILFHLAPEKKYAVLEEKIKGREATIPITVFSESREQARELMSEAPGIIADLEERFGPYPHESLLIYGWKGELLGAAGMEYAGATETDSWALRHELQHSWFARSIMPANGAAGWIDEACARWGDDGFQRKGAPRSTANLSSVSPFIWKTISQAYSDGGDFIAYLHDRFYRYQFEGQRGMIGLFRKLHAERKRTPISVFEFQAFLEKETNSNLASDFDRYVFAGRRQQHAELYASLADPKPGTIPEIPAGKRDEFASVEIVDLLANGNGRRQREGESDRWRELLDGFGGGGSQREAEDEDYSYGYAGEYRERIIAGENAEIPRERLEGAIRHLIGWGTVPPGTTVEDLERILAARGYRGGLTRGQGSGWGSRSPSPGPGGPEPRPAAPRTPPPTPPREPSPEPSPAAPRMSVQRVNIATDCSNCYGWKVAIAGTENFDNRSYEGRTHILYGSNNVEYQIRWFRTLEEAGDAGVEFCPDVTKPPGVRFSRSKGSPNNSSTEMLRASLSTEQRATDAVTRRLHAAGYRPGQEISRKRLEGAIRYLEESGTLPPGTTIEELERRLQIGGR